MGKGHWLESTFLKLLTAEPLARQACPTRCYGSVRGPTRCYGSVRGSYPVLWVSSWVLSGAMGQFGGPSVLWVSTGALLGAMGQFGGPSVLWVSTGVLLGAMGQFGGPTRCYGSVRGCSP
ncbi:hypothetical protein RRG08_014283 [Elysia crispata]|uniref:Uncharacterized protein n=1 Tax=Elysia crispata TaxID=231223 RepID=A0AAE0Y0R9_9GAST|nr:hypothetical protein RRG08_014283 [Elysia crispata]